MNRTPSYLALAAALLALACSAPSTSPSSAPMAPSPSPADPTGDAPTYGELFATYFALGTPGHCATSGCHADPGHNVWLCGTTKESCYAGMLDVGLINEADPTHSLIADPARSPLTWINPAGGIMPLDAQGENDSGRDAIQAWVAAGARND